jgi:hypothetical protein
MFFLLDERPTFTPIQNNTYSQCLGSLERQVCFAPAATSPLLANDWKFIALYGYPI